MRYKLLLLMILLSFCGSADLVSAHANLILSVPAANAALVLAPAEIRLWFTEPLEPGFSKFTLRDSNGSELEGYASEIDGQDPSQMFMAIPADTMTDGLYTVAWQVISGADGHPTRGNFSFTVGDPGESADTTTAVNETIPVDGTLIRSFNLYTLALLIGVAGFWLFTLRPALGETPAMVVEGRLWRLLMIAWVLVGIGGVLMLLNQVALVTELDLRGALGSPVLGRLVEGSRYGTLWLTRTALWLLIGLVMVMPGERRYPLRLRLLLLLGAVVLVTHSQFSHSSAVQDKGVSVINDWLHIFATTLWIGGLAAFVLTIRPIRRTVNPSAPTLGRMIGYFSNYARVCVAILAVTGLYAAWLHVGSLEALSETTYGRTLMLKLLLFFPLMTLAAINMLYSQRHLRHGRLDWIGRFRGLLGAEIALTTGVLLTVGVMTSISPARSSFASQEASKATGKLPTPYSSIYAAETMHVAFDIVPGWVGVNTFTATLADHIGNWINDATLVRLRFEHDTENVGRSELRLEHTADGTYSARGANLNLAGKWQVRVNIQRPNVFDTVLDFQPEVHPIPATADVTPPLTDRLIAMSALGLALLIVGGYSIAQSSLRPLRGAAVLAVACIGAGVLILVEMARLAG